jgi:hypothetical protein
VTDIVAVNYAYQIPHTLPPGRRLFRLVNNGTVPHEVQFYRFRPGIGPDSALRLLASESYPDSLIDPAGASVLIAMPGQSAPELVYAELRPGETYALGCTFRDSATAPRHNLMGMIGVIEVPVR